MCMAMSIWSAAVWVSDLLLGPQSYDTSESMKATWNQKKKKHQAVKTFLFFSLRWILKAPSSPNGHQGGAECSGEGQADGWGSVAEVRVAAGLGHGVAEGEDASRFSLVAEMWGNAASELHDHHAGAVQGCWQRAQCVGSKTGSYSASVRPGYIDFQI